MNKISQTKLSQFFLLMFRDFKLESVIEFDGLKGNKVSDARLSFNVPHWTYSLPYNMPLPA